MTSPLRHLLPLVLTLGVALPAMATNLNWMKDTPARHFTEQDWKQFSESLNQALGENRAVSWKNEQSGNGGSIAPLSSVERDGATCRQAEISNTAKGKTGKSNFTFCQKPDGGWAVAAGQ
jgi:surface antigen